MPDAYYGTKSVDYGDFYSAVTGQPAASIQKDNTPALQFNPNAPSGIVRVTPEGLNVRSTTTVPVDNMGQPVIGAPSKSPVVRALIANSPDMRNEPGIPASQMETLGYGRGPVGVSDFTPPAAMKAIDRATAPSAPLWGPGWGEGIGAIQMGRSPTRLISGPHGTFATGDSWAADRIGGETFAPRPGMVTGMAPGGVSPVAAALLARPDAFLQDRGIDTTNLTIGQQANELNRQLAGGSRNEDGSRGFM